MGGLMCWGAIFLFLFPATHDLYAGYRQVNRFDDPNQPPFEDASFSTQQQVNALLYGAGVCTMVSLAVLVDQLLLKHKPPSPSSPSDPPNRQRLGTRRQAVVILGTTADLLTMRPPTDSPSRAAAFFALVCAVASLMAGITVVRLWRLSSRTHRFGIAVSFFSDSLLVPSGDGESTIVPNLHCALSSPIAPSSAT